MQKNKKIIGLVSTIIFIIIVTTWILVQNHTNTNDGVASQSYASEGYTWKYQQKAEIQKIVSSDYFLSSSKILYFNFFNFVSNVFVGFASDTRVGNDKFGLQDITNFISVNIQRIKDINKLPYKISYITVSKDNQVQISKFGQIQSKIDIKINAQNKGVVKSINVKEGDSIKKGQSVIDISDDLANYDLMLEKSKLAVDSSVLQYSNTQNTFDKQIKDAELALSQAQNNFDITKQSTEQTVKQALLNLNNAKIGSGSLAELTLQQTQTNIDTQLDTVFSQYKTQKIQLKNFLKDLLYQTDLVFGITDANKTLNDNYEIYLSAKNTSVKNQVETEFQKLTQKQSDEMPGDEVNSDNIENNLNQLLGFYDDADQLVNIILSSIKYSVSSSSFSQSQIDGFVAKFSVFQTQSNGYRASLVQTISQANTVIQNVIGDTSGKNLADQQVEITQKNLQKQLENMEIAYQQTLIQQQDLLYKSETALQNAKNNLDNLKKTEQIQLELAQSSVKSSKTNYEDTYDNYKKLKVVSPVAGTIDQIFVEKGQEIQPGIPLVQVIDPKNQEIELNITKQDLSYLTVDTNVIVIHNNIQYPGKISSISAQTNDKLLYDAKILSDIKNANIGDLVSIIVPIKSDKIMLLIESVIITKQNIGYVYTLNETNNLEQNFVELGNVRGDKIEILSGIKAKDKIVTTSLVNFDSNQFKLEVE